MNYSIKLHHSAIIILTVPFNTIPIMAMPFSLRQNCNWKRVGLKRLWRLFTFYIPSQH